MRVEIGVFVAEAPLTDRDALQWYRTRRHEPGPMRPIKTAPRLDAFLSELVDRYPAPETLCDDDRADSPWDSRFEVSDTGAVIGIGGRHCAEAVEFLLQIAERHDLVCFDPKTRSILTAPPGLHIEQQSDAAIWPLTVATLSLALVGLLWLH